MGREEVREKERDRGVIGREKDSVRERERQIER